MFANHDHIHELRFCFECTKHNDWICCESLVIFFHSKTFLIQHCRKKALSNNHVNILLRIFRNYDIIYLFPDVSGRWVHLYMSVASVWIHSMEAFVNGDHVFGNSIHLPFSFTTVTKKLWSRHGWRRGWTLL